MKMILQQYAAEHEGQSDEEMIIHRDFAPFNLVFSPTYDVLAVNDFDNCCRGSSLADLAELIVTHTLINYAGSTSSMKEPIITYIDIKRAESMLRRYIRSRDVYDASVLR